MFQKDLQEYIDNHIDELQYISDVSKLPRFPPKTEIRRSTYGRGLFATQPIEKGEVIAYYPADYILTIDKNGLCAVYADTPKEYTDHIHDLYQLNILKDEHGNSYNISADPLIKHEPIFNAHFINDPCTDAHTLKRYATADTLLKNILRYCKEQKNRNAILSKHDKFAFSVAVKDISENEEITHSYGLNYWLNKTEEQIKEKLSHCQNKALLKQAYDLLSQSQTSAYRTH